MLTGQRLFEGETISDTLIEVATKEPDWDRVPKKVRRLLRRCLEKDPKKRLRDIGDVESLLEDAPQEATVQPAPSPSSDKSQLGLVASMAAAVFAVALAALALIHFREAASLARAGALPDSGARKE
jgi:serine/threonine-protein kinase